MNDSDADAYAEGLAFKICTLREEGQLREAAALCPRLISCDPSRLDFRFLEFDLLHRCKDRPSLERRLEDAMICLRESIELRIYYAAVPMWYFDWSMAIERLQGIRRDFSHLASVDVAATVLDEFQCYFEIGDLDSSRKLVQENWALLRSWPAEKFNGKNEIFEIAWMIDEENFEDYVGWSAGALDGDLRKNYLARMRAASVMRRWVGEKASDIDVVSVGQNCLPWVVPNRWGLRPHHHTARPMSVFDYIGAPRESAFRLMHDGFSDFLAAEHLADSPFPNGAPMLMNTKYRILFFHEKGIWWAEDGWRRLRDAYGKRIAFFLADDKARARLYVLCVNGACDLDVAVQCFAERLSGGRSRLLVINAQRTPVKDEIENTDVTVKNIPYPSDYSYVDRPSFESDNGHAFESAVAAAIVSELRSMRRDRPRFMKERSRAKALFASLRFRSVKIRARWRDEWIMRRSAGS